MRKLKQLYKNIKFLMVNDLSPQLKTKVKINPNKLHKILNRHLLEQQESLSHFENE